jgi:hypothetical protein
VLFLRGGSEDARTCSRLLLARRASRVDFVLDGGSDDDALDSPHQLLACRAPGVGLAQHHVRASTCVVLDGGYGDALACPRLLLVRRASQLVLDRGSDDDALACPHQLLVRRASQLVLGRGSDDDALACPRLLLVRRASRLVHVRASTCVVLDGDSGHLLRHR